ncbi:MAG: peptidase M41, partial [Thermoflexibacter sp.]|nr:peptidase M41 [Thermoflexibacter sp.]
MSENQDNKKNMLPKPSSKNNYQIWLLVTLILFIVGLTYFNRNNSAIEINQKRFEKILAAGDVKEIIIVNDRFVEVTLTAEAMRKPEYQQEVGVQRNTPFGATQSPQFRFNIISAEIFKEDLEKLQKDIPSENRIGFKPENRTDFNSWFFSWGFFIILIFGFYFLMRRMTGGGPGGQIFNIGRSRATLFDSESKIKITFSDVAGLD